MIRRTNRIRIGTEWYRIDLVLYHRVLRCLVLADLKRGKFTHADAGQMNLYLNYAQEHLTFDGESDPIGIILCSDKEDAVVKYATGGINAKVFASKYLTALPDEDALRAELITTQEVIAKRIEERTPQMYDSRNAKLFGRGDTFMLYNSIVQWHPSCSATIISPFNDN